MLSLQTNTTLSEVEKGGDYQTDKNTTHSYIELYDRLLAPYCKRAINLLEIGNHQGGSLKLWNDYFSSAEIYGLELLTNDNLTRLDKENENMHLIQGIDAYSHDAINKLFRTDTFFDIIIDDGSHHPVHQVFVLNDWYPMMKPGGLMIIEDVTSLQMAAQIVDSANKLTPDDRVTIFDRRHIKKQSDDIAIVINKGKE